MARTKRREGSAMSRRSFIGTGLLGGMAVVVGNNLIGPAASRAARRWVGAADVKFDWEELTVTDAQAALKSGKLSARRLTEMYLGRIEKVDRGGPALNSIIETNPEALAIADALDRERKRGRVRGPLHGIPVLIKDNISTADRMETTAGSLALVGARPAADAFILRRPRGPGAGL